MKTLDRLLSVEGLASMLLAGDRESAICVQILHNDRIAPESPLLFPRQDRRVREIEGNRHLGLDLIDVLPAGAAGTSKRKAQFVVRDS
jgi:hypothetical protein